MSWFIDFSVVRRGVACVAVLVAVSAQCATSVAQYYTGNCGCTAPCDCGAGVIPGHGDFYDEEMAPGDGIPFPDSQDAGAPPAQPDTPGLQLSQEFGGGGQFFVTNFAPPSIGDSFSPSWKVFIDPMSSRASFYEMDAQATCIPSPSGAAVLGRMKMADNHSPLPQNRIFFDYNYFHNAALVPGGLELHRFAPGFESTFFDGMMSFEMRVPMAVTVNSNLSLDAETGSFLGDIENGEFGNLQFVWKTLLVEGPAGAIAGGLAVTAPTADDVNVFLDGTPLFRVENESVHLMPYVAALRRFGPNVFVQAFLQVDVDANGNPVLLDDFGNGFVSAGRVEDQTLLYADISAGAWIYRNPGDPLIQGLALVTEAHYTASVEDSPSVTVDGITIGDPNQELDMVNLTFGAHMASGQNMLTLAYGVPVTDDRVFDGELRLFINRFY